MSFDVISLYTKIPIQEAIDIINRITDKDTAKLGGLPLLSLVSKVSSMNKPMVF